MSVTAVIGMQWGDEGKGKIVDVIGEEADIVARCQGGGNAGHTVVIGKDIFKLHLIPCGILRKNAVAVIGNGVVLDPEKIMAEIEGLNEKGITTADRLFISDRAHIVFPFHKILDGLKESARGAGNLGTTKQGIGPTYCDKASRCGIRGHHLQNPEEFLTLLKTRHCRREQLYLAPRRRRTAQRGRGTCRSSTRSRQIAPIYYRYRSLPATSSQREEEDTP